MRYAGINPDSFSGEDGPVNDAMRKALQMKAAIEKRIREGRN